MTQQSMTKQPNQANAVDMLNTMATMQDGYNQVLHPQWQQQGHQYYRAIWVECAEMLDHYGWKWWKHSPPDLDQVKLELVDIWHFGLSELLRDGLAAPTLAESFVDAWQAATDPAATAATEDFRLLLEAFALRTLADRRFALSEFLAILASMPLPLPELFDLYVGKNVLNGFRQDHGYRTGEYRKLWAGREDNEHLVDALSALSCSPEQVPKQLYDALLERYQASAG